MKHQKFKFQKALRNQPRLIPLLIPLLIVFLGQSLTFAQTSSAPARLTLARAVELALKADYQVKSDANSLEKAKLAAQKAALDILPQATIEGQYQYQTTDSSYPSGYQFVVQETVPTANNWYGLKIDSTTQAAMWDQMIAEATFQIDQAEVLYNTYDDYVSVLKLQQMIKQEEQAVAIYRESSALAIKQLSLGKITKPNQMKIENYLNQAQYDLEKDRSDLEIAGEKLASQTGLKDISAYQLEEVNFESGAVVLDLAPAQQKALQRRLELKKYDLTLKKVSRTWAEAKNDELPTLSFNYDNKTATQSYSLGYDFLSGDVSWLAAHTNSSDLSSSGSSSTSYFSTSGTKSYFTLKLSWNLDFGTKANITKQSQYGVENSRLDLEKEQQAISLEVKQAWADYRMAVKQQELDQKAVAYYNKTVEIDQLQAKLGTITYADLAEAQQNALEARINAIKSGYDQIMAYQKLQKVTGNLYPVAQ